jgi:hypothetical protein
MKKILSAAILLIATCTMVMAQPRAIGGRFPLTGVGVSYQHQIGEKNMIQADIDGNLWWGTLGIQGTVTYNWLIPLVSVNAGNLNLYPGVGIGGGIEWWNDYIYFFQPGRHNYTWRNRGFLGVAGMIGIEWNFNKIPLQLSFEYRPLIGVDFSKLSEYYNNPEKIYTSFYTNGLWTKAFAISVRYKFGK